jgi:3-oxoadipate enol-lactonase
MIADLDEELAMTERVSLRGIDIAYSEFGSGQLVLDAHGLSSSRAGNARLGLADFSAVAAEGFRLLSYDARGHGESTGSPDEEAYSWSELAKDMLALADHFSPDEPVSAIGSSMGTGTLLHAVTQRPERFDRLVLTAPPTAWDSRAAQASGYRMIADAIDASGLEALAAMFSQAPVPPIFQGLDGFPPPPDIAAELMPTVFRGAARADLPSLDQIARITHPTLILAWDGDPGHPVSTARILAETIPGSTLEVADSVEQVRGWGARAAGFLSNAS